MAKHPTKKEKEHINELLEAFSWLFEIQWHNNKILYMADNKRSETDGSLSVGAEMFFDEMYRETELKIFPNFFDESRLTQAKILLHELAHCKTIPSKECAILMLKGVETFSEKEITKRNEMVTCFIEQIIHSFLVNEMSSYKKAFKSYVQQDDKKKAN